MEKENKMVFDARLTNLGVKATQTSNAVWDLTVAKYQDETQAGGNHHIYFTVLDVAGQPMPNITCVVDWVGRAPSDPPTKVVTDANGQTNVPIYANLDITLKNGPYFAFVENQTISDIVTGMGLPEKHHVNFLLTFARQASGAPTPPVASLEQTVITEAQQHTWMPINDQAALYKFAQQNSLGYPQTDEFLFTCNNESYIGQVFNLGIVYVKKGDWGNVKWVKKQ
jgi:hypothetical protein